MMMVRMYRMIMEKHNYNHINKTNLYSGISTLKEDKPLNKGQMAGSQVCLSFGGSTVSWGIVIEAIIYAQSIL